MLDELKAGKDEFKTPKNNECNKELNLNNALNQLNSIINSLQLNLNEKIDEIKN